MFKPKKVAAYILCLTLLFSSFTVSTYANGNTYTNSFVSASIPESAEPTADIRNLIVSYFSYLDTAQPELILSLLCNEEKAEFSSFVVSASNKDNHLGLFNYKSAEVLSIEAASISPDTYATASQYADISNITCWRCIVNVSTYRNSSYLCNGNNHFIMIVGEYSQGVPVIVGILRDTVLSDCQDDSTQLVPLSYDAPVNVPSVGTWTSPSTIKVLYDGDVEEVNFKSYCYIVTNCEVGSTTYNQTARKAVALAIKNYGWHRTLVQKYSNFEYDVKSTSVDQVYDPQKTLSTNASSAVNAIWGYVMLSCDYKLFCGFHTASSSVNSYAREHGGIVSQTQADDLADDGYTWQEILHYFYDYGSYNSEMTSGTIRIVSLNHSPSGISYASSEFYHWITCTTCGCAHTKSEHSWAYKSSQSLYECTVCGRTASSIPSVSSIEMR